MKKWYAVIGNPIHHSISPRMHEIWFRTHNIDASYVPILVEPDRLEQSVESLFLLGCSGFNVTVPFKEAIMPFLDELDQSARSAGAVNTVVRTQTGWKGYNTDGRGLLASIPNLSQSTRILLIGAGGAAKGIAAALSDLHIRDVTICNRTLEKATQLANKYNAKVLDMSEVPAKLPEFDCVIQTTTVGMDSEESPLSNPIWTSEMVAVDIIYSPPQTEFLKLANSQGAFTMNGLAMLIGQGALAFELWTGIKPDQKEIVPTIFSS